MDDEIISMPSAPVRRVCSTSNSEDSSEDSFGDDGRTPLLHGPVSNNANCVKIDLSQSDSVIKSATSVHDKYPKEHGKTALAVAMLMVAALCNDMVLSFIHEKVPDQPSLPDIVFDNIPYVPSALAVSEYLMLISFFIMALITLLHRHRWIVIRRIAVIGSLLYFGRCLTMLVTQVPVADHNYYCSPRFEGANKTAVNTVLRALRIASGVGLMINGKQTLCGDYIYSGHTIVLVITSLFIREYSPRGWRPLHILSLLISAAGIILLLISHGHYTIDVIIAYWITTRVFWIYHTLAAYPSLKDTNCNHNHLSKLYWFRLFKYMEGNVHKPLPRKFDSPFPRWRWCSRASLQTCKSNTL